MRRFRETSGVHTTTCLRTTTVGLYKCNMEKKINQKIRIDVLQTNENERQLPEKFSAKNRWEDVEAVVGGTRSNSEAALD